MPPPLWAHLLASALVSASVVGPSPADGARILCFFPFPGKSHHRLFAPLAGALAGAGHVLDYYSPFPLGEEYKSPNITEILIPDFGREVLGTIDFQQLGRMWIPFHLDEMYSKLRQLLTKVLQVKEVRQLIHSNGSFDAVILESYFFQEANSALVHKFGAVGIEVVPLGDFVWLNELTGVSVQNSYMTDYKTHLTDELSFRQRVYTTLVGWASVAACYKNLLLSQVLMDRYFDYAGSETRPPLSRLAPNRSLVLLNKSPYLGFPYPTAPHVKEVGGLNVVPAKPLPKDLKDFMDGAKSGVIYMSLGLNMEVSGMLEKTIGAFLEVFKNLPQRVLLKWEKEGEEMPGNVLTSKRFPQQDILAHPNCRLFITHGGVLSLFETAHHGVPVLGIPFYGDQPRNILWAQSVGVGLYLDKDNITVESVSWALDELLNNERYTLEMRKRSDLLRSRRQKPLDEAVYWIEQVIKFPGALTPRAVHLSFWVFHEIDVLIFLICSLGMTLLIAYKIAARFSKRSKSRKVNRKFTGKQKKS